MIRCIFNRHRFCWKHFRNICKVLEVWAKTGVKQWYKVCTFSKKGHSVAITFILVITLETFYVIDPYLQSLILCLWPLAPGYRVTKYLLQSLTKSKSKSRIKSVYQPSILIIWGTWSLIIPLHITLWIALSWRELLNNVFEECLTTWSISTVCYLVWILLFSPLQASKHSFRGTKWHTTDPTEVLTRTLQTI